MAGNVPVHGMTSTSGSAVGGLKKCSPMTRSRCLQAAAIAVIESDDVLEASTASGPTTRSIDSKSFFLAARFSTMASMTRPHPWYVTMLSSSVRG